MSRQSPIICIAGPMGSGKSTVAAHLVSKYGFERHAFSEPLKNMLRALGLTEDHISGHLKETPLPILGGKSPRHAMQTLGTDWGRGMIHDDFWVTLWKRKVLAKRTHGVPVVEDGTRFMNEVAACQKIGGTLIYVERPTEQIEMRDGKSHVSELSMKSIKPVADHVIVNNGNFRTLYAQVEEIMEDIIRGAA